MKIFYTEHKTNEKVLQMIGEKICLAKEIIRRTLQYFGHLITRNRVQKKLLEAEAEGTRGNEEKRKTKGRQKKTPGNR